MQINRVDQAMVNGLVNTEQIHKKLKNTKKVSSTNNNSVRSRAESIIKEAIESHQSNPVLVAQAKQLLDSGQLDTVENIESAVRKILKYGF